MANVSTIKVNFKGGIVPPHDLYNILVAATKSGLLYVRFGLRQQLLFDFATEKADEITAELDSLGVSYNFSNEEYPNIVSSYPAEEIFINNTWLTEKIYREIFDSFSFRPRLKVNICDRDQSFTPMLTGNINWVASQTERDFWH